MTFKSLKVRAVLIAALMPFDDPHACGLSDDCKGWLDRSLRQVLHKVPRADAACFFIVSECEMERPVVHLLCKKRGGHRRICTVASLYRLPSKLEAEEEADWNVSIAHKQGSAQEGGGALKAAEDRLIRQEIKQVTGKSVS